MRTAWCWGKSAPADRRSRRRPRRAATRHGDGREAASPAGRYRPCRALQCGPGRRAEEDSGADGGDARSRRPRRRRDPRLRAVGLHRRCRQLHADARAVERADDVPDRAGRPDVRRLRQQRGDPGLHDHGQALRHGRRPCRRDREGLAEARRPPALDRAGEARARRVPRVAARPAVVRRERPDRTRRHPARRARRRLRRRLLPRRPRGVQQRQPLAVHAVRRRAPGGLLQREHGRLQPDGDPRVRRPCRPPAVELGPVRDRGEVRGASVPRDQGRRDRPDPGWVGAVRVLRRRRPLRRRHRPDLARVQRREHAGRPRDDPHPVPGPQADPVPGAARGEVPARVVRGGQGRDDHRHPRAGARSCARCRTSAST